MSLGDALDEVLDDLGAATSGQTVDLVDRWVDVVGERLATCTHPLGVRDRVLVVAADEPPVAERLLWEEGAVLERLTALLGPGVITALRVRVRPREQ